MRVENRIEEVPGWLVYVVSVSGATPAEIARAKRILASAELSIRDKAPELFTGPPPLNTNQTDLQNYTPEQGVP